VTSLAGLGSAAAVAAMAILWMRAQGPAVIAQSSVPQKSAIAVTPQAAAVAQPDPQTRTAARQTHEPDSYVTPAAAPQGPTLVQPTELANYIVAHSAYSGPLMRRNALSALVGGDSAVPQAIAQPVAATAVTVK
jgi:hypothetical protein